MHLIFFCRYHLIFSVSDYSLDQHNVPAEVSVTVNTLPDDELVNRAVMITIDTHTPKQLITIEVSHFT